MTRIMTVRVTDELQEKLKQMAKERGYTRNGLVLQILWDWTKKNERQQASEVPVA